MDRQEAEKIFETLYANVKGSSVSYQERERLKISDNKNFVYGEITFPTLAELLDSLEPREGEQFYDLGSGTGKSTFIATLLYPFARCVGIEYLPALYQQSQQILKEFEEKVPEKKEIINFIQGNILELNWEHADILYINATCFDDNLWNKIVEKAHELKNGSRLIVTTQHIYSDQFEMIHDQSHQMSWGMNSVRVYKKQKAAQPAPQPALAST